MNFPFGSYKQVFLEPDMAISSISLGASVSIFSSHILFDEKIIDQVCSFLKLAFDDLISEVDDSPLCCIYLFVRLCVC